MNRVRTGIFLLAGSAVAIGYWRLQTNATNTALPTTQPRTASAAEVDALRVELRALREQSSHAARVATHAAAASESAMTAAASRIGKATDGKSTVPPPQPDDSGAKRAEAFGRRLSQEPVDRAWSKQIERSIKQAVDEAAPTAEVVEAKCGSTLCRTVLKHENVETRRNFPGVVADKEPFKHGATYRYDPDGRGMTVYVSREGYGFSETARN